MKFFFTSTFILSSVLVGAQFRNAPSPQQYFPSFAYPSQQKTFIPNLLADPIQNSRQPAPMLTNLAFSDWRAQNNFFWTGTITTMSFNKGKMGTLYYWDVQGNLRGSRGFVDLTGKRKLGVKLVFPWRKF